MLAAAGSRSAATGASTHRPCRTQGQDLDVPDDPDTPYAENAVDAELLGEKPEEPLRPDDDDVLPD
jgi:hypothetical protein